jgi:hypothetical protein
VVDNIDLTCINASGESISNFYIFRGKRCKRNYIVECEHGATMAMSKKAWMTTFLFSTWIDHFIQGLRSLGGISPNNPHLLIFDAHSSYIIIPRSIKCQKLNCVYLRFHRNVALLCISNLEGSGK